MDHLISWLFGFSDLSPHGFCLLWRPDLVWPFILASGSIAAAYFSIPLCLTAIVRQRDDVAMPGLFWLFSSFIALCGATHVMDIVTLWVPAYGLDVVIEVATALVAVATAVTLWRLLPAILQVPSVQQYRAANLRLEGEIGERRAAEDTLRRLSAELEARVDERTAVLADAHERLRLEVLRRTAIEEALRQVFDGAPSGMIIVDAAGQIEMANAEVARIFGYTKAELVGRCVDDLVPERARPDHPRLRADFVAAPERRGMDRGSELFARRKNGTEFPAEIGLNPINGADGLRIISTIVDITQRKEYERQILASERQSQLMIESLHGHAIYMLDPLGHVVTWNAGAERLKGFRRDEILGQHVSRFYTPADLAAGKPERDLRIAEREGRVEDEGLRVRADGSHLMAHVTISALRDKDEKLIGFVKVTRDVSERIEIQRQLKEAYELNAVAAAAGGLGFWDWDIARNAVHWDDTMYRLFGFDRGAGERPYQLWIERLHPDDRGETERKLLEAAAGGAAYDTTYRIVLDDGQTRHLRASGTLCRRSDNALHMIGVNSDITDIKAAQLAVERARDEAQAANRAKSEFLAVMSHEVRTPMNGIMGMNDLLLTTVLTPQQRRMAQTIAYSADALLAILDDVLDVAKLEAGKVEVDEVDFLVSVLADKTKELFEPKAREKGLLFEVDKQGITQNALRGDPSRLRQIALNLVSNAIKFTTQGTVRLVVATGRATTRPGTSLLHIEVQDSGPGVGEAARLRLFHPFEQADSSITRRFGGTGLGLSICKRLVDLMGGQIGVRDRPGGGAIFWVDVTLADGTSAAEISDTLARPEPPSHMKGHGHLLLVEDNPINVELATMLLQDAGYSVDVMTDGLQAVEAVKTNRYDLVLMDMQMPNLDGLAATRLIRTLGRQPGTLPIVAMTANAMPEDRARCLDAGMDDYISKPLNASKLLGTIAHWIGEREGAAQLVATGPAQVEEDAPLLDESVLGPLRRRVTRPRFAYLMTMFLAQIEAKVAALQGLADDMAAFHEIGQIAHDLVGSAGSVGAAALSMLAARLQASCHDRDALAVRSLIASTVVTAAATADAMHKMLDLNGRA